MKKRILLPLIFAIFSCALTACGNSAAGETAFTAAQGPADSALPYQAVFAVNENADERLVLAAKNFCLRTSELSRGGAVFNLILSKNALQDLKMGKADVILIENEALNAFAPVSEAFRYKSYEHFAMTANADSTLRILSDILGADVFAGFYAGSNILLSHGTLDSKFRPVPRKESENSQDSQVIPVTALSDSTAHAFSLLKTNLTVAKELEARIDGFYIPDSVVEFSYAELDSTALLEAIRNSALERPPNLTSDSAESLFIEPDSGSVEPKPVVATQAFTGIKPVWLVFAAGGYEKLSQTNRAATAEATAYMVSDIDGIYLEYEREMIELLSAEAVSISHDFAATRIQALRLADEQDAKLTGIERKLKDAVAQIQ